MAEETSQSKTPAQIKLEQAQQAAAAEAADALEAATKYKAMVGKRFTNGKQIAEVRDYVPSRLTTLGAGKAEPRQCFVVNFGHKHVCFYLPCFEFAAEYSSDAAAYAEQTIDMNPIVLPK